MPIVAIDFDNTIHDPSNKLPGKHLGGLVEGAEEALDDLYRAGHTIIIHSVMANTPGGRKALADWLEYFAIDYHEIQGKPEADYYIDDKAIEFKTWPRVLKKIGYTS